MAASWGDFEAAAPALARSGREAFERTGVVLLGTLRKDGSPRISPVEPVFAVGQLLVGVMPWSQKARDLARDARCTVHSAVTAPHAGESEFKLYGTANEADAEVRDAPADAWWVSRPRAEARVLSLGVELAVLLEWDLQRGEMAVTRWAPETGSSREGRAYP